MTGRGRVSLLTAAVNDRQRSQMEETKARLCKFIFDGLMLWGMAVPAFWLISGIGESVLRQDFLLLYFAAFFFAALFTEVINRRKLLFILIPVIVVTVFLTSRDTLLLWNCLTACGVCCILLLILFASFRKWILPLPVILLLVFCIPNEELPGFTAGCLLLSFLGVVSEFLRGAKRERFLPLLGGVSLLACMIPSSPEPMQWEGLKKAISGTGDLLVTGWKNVSYFFEGLFGDEDVSYLGYSESGGLSGGLIGSEREELYFKKEGKKQPVYLQGSVYTGITAKGLTGKMQQELPVNAWMAPYLSALSVAGVTRAEAACFSKVERADVTYAYIRTGDLIIPSTIFRIRNDLKYGLDETAKKGFSYDLGYFIFDYASPYFRDFCDRAGRLKGRAGYDEAVRVAKELYDLPLPEYLTRDEYEASMTAYEETEQAPDCLDTTMVTDRMQELADQLTKGCDTDRKKAENIERFLRQYTYDQSVDLRGSENYVDAFLFEAQKGYCMHFASAMVCLLRASGVPARIVQGFLHEPNEEGLVTSQEAHVWVEGYLSGVGWVRYEPTATMASAEETGWGLVLKEPGKEELPEKKEVVQEDPEELPAIPEIMVLPEKQTTEGTSFRQIMRTVVFYLLVILGLAAVSVAGYLLVRRILYLRLPAEEKLKTDMAALRKKLDMKLPEGERAESVFDYLPYIDDETVRSRLTELFRKYYRVRFRRDAVTPELQRDLHLASKEKYA